MSELLAEGRACKILVVDDLESNLNLLSLLLKPEGYIVHTALNGGLALQSVAENPPDLLLLDVLMPKIDGFEVCRRLKANPDTADIPIIFMTSLSDTDRKVEGFRVGGVDYIIKPFQSQEVLVRVKNHLALRKAQQRLNTQNLQLRQEVAEHKETVRQLAQLQKAIETTEVGVTISDRKGRIIYTNPADAVMHGFTPEELIGQPSNILGTPEALVDDSWRAVADVEAYSNWKRETLNRRRNGEIFPVELISNPIYDEEDNLTGFVTVCRDITESKQVREELEQAKTHAEIARGAAEEARKMADSSNQAKSAFLANMSHELRTPLNAILGFSQVLAHGRNLTDEQQESLKTINQSGEHLLTLINQILDLSKIEAGYIVLNEEALDLYRLLEDVMDMFRLTAEKKGLQLKLERSESLLQYVWADETKFRQILLNLLSNAVKFSAEGQVVLSVESRLKGHLAHLQVSVRDTGTGIPHDEIVHLFEAFRQTSSGKHSREGTGLGLAICQKFLDAMGGEIHVESEIGKGSVFIASVALKIAQAEDLSLPFSTRPILSIAPDHPSYRVLVVDDKANNRKVVTQLLQAQNFALREAKNGQEALDIWEEWSPHLIWMDMRMPVMNGYEATRCIRKAEEERGGDAEGLGAPNETKIIALTASTFEEERAGILEAGCDDVLYKPFRESELFELLRRHLGIQVIYDDGRAPDAAETTSKLSECDLRNALAALDVELLQQLKYAADCVNMLEVEKSIVRISEKQTALAEMLRYLAEQFDYEKISLAIAAILKENLS